MCTLLSHRHVNSSATTCTLNFTFYYKKCSANSADWSSVNLYEYSPLSAWKKSVSEAYPLQCGVLQMQTNLSFLFKIKMAWNLQFCNIYWITRHSILLLFCALSCCAKAVALAKLVSWNSYFINCNPSEMLPMLWDLLKKCIVAQVELYHHYWNYQFLCFG